LELSEAVAEAASADPVGRRDRLHAAPRRRILRRLVPAPGPRPRDRSPAQAPAADGGREGPRPAHDLDLGVPRAARQGGVARIRGGRHRPRGARNPRPEPRPDPADPRRLCAAAYGLNWIAPPRPSRPPPPRPPTARSRLSAPT